jgi:hypothetical protein
MFLAVKGLESHASKWYLWGPQADAMEQVVMKAYDKVGRKYLNNVVKAFDLTGDISVSRGALNSALSKMEKGFGNEMWLACGAKVKTVLEDTVEATLAHYTKQQNKAARKQYEELLTEENWEAMMVQLETRQMRAYMMRYTQRIAHPEIIRMRELALNKPEFRHVARVQLLDRIQLLPERSAEYFRSISDVQVGRTWVLTGLINAQRQGVTEYIIIAEHDARTCPVCERLSGRTFPVGPAAEKYTEALEAEPDQVAAIAPFPRVPDIDNRSYPSVRSLNLAPPFHPKCRCDVEFIWGDVGAAPVAAAPGTPKPAAAQAAVSAATQFFTPKGTFKFPKDVKWLKSSAVKGMENLGGGVNGSYIITHENGLKSVFKPDKLEAGNLKKWAKGSLYKREQLAYKIDALVEGNMVPPTMAITVKETETLSRQINAYHSKMFGKGSAQAFRKDATVAASANNALLDSVPKASKQKMGLFDYIGGNSDRHHGNWMIINSGAKKGNLVAIDNGLMFQATNKDRSWAWIDSMRWDKCPNETKIYVRRLIRNRKNIAGMIEKDLETRAVPRALKTFNARMDIIEEWIRVGDAPLGHIDDLRFQTYR